MVKKKNISVLERLQHLQGLESRPLEKWLIHRKLHAIKHLQDTESLVEQVFSICVEKIQLMETNPESIFYILESPLKSNWTTFLDKLNTSSDPNILTILLFKTLVQELTSNEKEYKPFWTTAYEELSEKLWSPTETGLADLAMTSSKALSTRQVEKLHCLTSQKINLRNRNLQMTSYPLSISLVADKWEEEITENPVKFKTLAVKVQMSKQQKQIYKEQYGCFRYVHNQTLDRVKKHGEEPNFQDLRNLLVTKDTKMHSNTYKYHMLCIQTAKRKEKAIAFKIQEEEKEFKKRISKDKQLSNEEKKILKNSFKTPVSYAVDASAVFLNYTTEITTWIQDMLLRKTNQEVLVEEEEALLEKALKPIPSRKNPYVSNWEREFHCKLRSNAVKKVCESYKTAIANFKAGNIKSFDIKYMSSKEPRKCIELASGQLSIKNKNIHIPLFKGCPTLKVSKKMAKKLNGIQIKNNCDFVCQKNSYWILIPVKIKLSKLDIEKPRYCGVDPGIVKIATTFGNYGITEYTHNRELLQRYNLKLTFLKTKRTLGRVRKKQLNKVEKKKIDYTNQLHWKLIKSLLDENDVVFFGDIKSHDIVKDGNNSSLNQEFNDLKFYRLKQRLIYKSKTRGKKVILVNEKYTSMTCSICGNLKKMTDRIYNCKGCKTTVDRDINAAKNILMRGILCM